jgi:soluble P-type ATPase
MIEINLPGQETMCIEHLVLDHNGTLAVDGILVEGVKAGLDELSRQLKIHVVTADTFGKARSQLEGVPCDLTVLPPGNQGQAKLAFVQNLGSRQTACIGNGRNDLLMLKEAVLGIAVILAEGAAAGTVAAADVVCVGIVPALELLLNPLRLTATLRS